MFGVGSEDTKRARFQQGHAQEKGWMMMGFGLSSESHVKRKKRSPKNAQWRPNGVACAASATGSQPRARDGGFEFFFFLPVLTGPTPVKSLDADTHDDRNSTERI